MGIVVEDFMDELPAARARNGQGLGQDGRLAPFILRSVGFGIACRLTCGLP